MANYKQLARLERIVHALTSKDYITKKELLDELQERHDIQISERSLERDLKELKDNFSLDINYSHHHQGYSLEPDDRLLSRFFKFAELNSLAKIYEVGLKNYAQFEKWILPDDGTKLTGIYNFDTIIKAMNLGKKLRFMKENFHTGEISERVVTALKLKEYLNRWYLIAVKDGEDVFKNYGIERISELEILKKPGVDVKPYAPALEQYNHIVGINYSNQYFDNRVKIVCQTYDYQHKYLASLPLHHSQEISHISETGEAQISFYLKPNYEFITQLLRMNDNIVVIEPLELSEIVKKQLELGLRRYL
jgi:predicted DNA-binding transcriptional regulator YafY